MTLKTRVRKLEAKRPATKRPRSWRALMEATIPPEGWAEFMALDGHAQAEQIVENLYASTSGREYVKGRFHDDHQKQN
jgi:hypothetical protein